LRQRGSLLVCAELKGLGNKPGKKAAYTPPAYGLIAATAEKPSTRPGALLIEGRSAFCPVCFGRRASETFADGVAVTPGSFADQRRWWPCARWRCRTPHSAFSECYGALFYLLGLVGLFAHGVASRRRGWSLFTGLRTRLARSVSLDLADSIFER